MEFRIVSIREIPSTELGTALELELENTQESQFSPTSGKYVPIARLTAYVPDSGEFHGLTIGQVLKFGSFATIAYDPTSEPAAYDPTRTAVGYDPAREGHWKSPTVIGKFDNYENFTGDLTYPPSTSITGLPPGGCTSSSVNTNEREADKHRMAFDDAASSSVVDAMKGNERTAAQVGVDPESDPYSKKWRP